MQLKLSAASLIVGNLVYNNYNIVVNELDSGSTIEFYSPAPLDAGIDSMIVTVVELVELMHPVYYCSELFLKLLHM